MALSVSGTGPYKAVPGAAMTSYVTYAFFSGEVTTTDNFEDNIFVFGANLGEIVIQNTGGSNKIAFQWPDDYIPNLPANTASGIVLPNSQVIFRRCNKNGIKIRSANSGSQSTFCIFGI